MPASSKMLSKTMSGIYEPDYLEVKFFLFFRVCLFEYIKNNFNFQAIKPKYPLYPPITVQIRGYDFPVLESYQSWINKIADVMDFDVEDR